MKVKLLKKIRKRFDYYIRGSDGVPIVLDKQTKEVTIFIIDTLVDLSSHKDEEALLKSLEVSLDLYRWRTAKGFMYKSFGYTISRLMYREAYRNGKHYKPFKPKTNV
jgi:hypothetical protein